MLDHVHAGDEKPGLYYFDCAWLKVIQCVITHRHLSIYPFTPQLALVHDTCPWMSSGASASRLGDKSGSELDAIVDTFVSSVLVPWGHTNKEQYPRGPRWMREPTVTIENVVSGFEDEDVDMLFQFLQLTPFDFLKTQNNRKAYRARLCKDLLLEAIWKRTTVIPLLEEESNAPLLRLLHMVVHGIKRVGAYNNFVPAIALPAQPPTPLQVPDIEAVMAAMGDAEYDRIRRGTIKAFNAFIRSLNVRGAGGIPHETKLKPKKGETDPRIKTEYRLHPTLAARIAAVYGEVESISQSLWARERRSIPVSTFLDSAAQGEVSQDLPISLPICDIEYAQSYYNPPEKGVHGDESDVRNTSDDDQDADPDEDVGDQNKTTVNEDENDQNQNDKQDMDDAPGDPDEECELPDNRVSVKDMVVDDGDEYTGFPDLDNIPDYLLLVATAGTKRPAEDNDPEVQSSKRIC